MRITSTSRTLRGLCAAMTLAVTLAAVAVAPAFADGPSRSSAIAAARQQARKLARETHAASFHVIGCRRSTPVRYVCQVENRFTTGSRRCTATVVVRFVRRRASVATSNYLCF